MGGRSKAARRAAQKQGRAMQRGGGRGRHRTSQKPVREQRQSGTSKRSGWSISMAKKRRKASTKRQHFVFDEVLEETHFLPGAIHYPDEVAFRSHFMVPSGGGSNTSSNSSGEDEERRKSLTKLDGDPEQTPDLGLPALSGKQRLPPSASLGAPVSVPVEDPDPVNTARVLDLLGAGELSATYGKGFQLLSRMGFRPGESIGRRKNGLLAPLKAHNQGRSRRGVQSAEDLFVEEAAEVQSDEDVDPSQLASRRQDLLSSFLRSMRQVGDVEEADELLRLANTVGFASRIDEGTGSATSHSNQASQSLFSGEQLFEAGHDDAATVVDWRRKRSSNRGVSPSSSSSSSSSSSASMEPGDALRHIVDMASASTSKLRFGEEKALIFVHKRLVDDVAFPVELGEQAKALLWRRRFQEELGNFKDFLQRWPDRFRVLACPGGGQHLVLPVPVCETNGSFRTSGAELGAELGALAGKYAGWCHQQRCAAHGRNRSKWRQFQKTVLRFCKQLHFSAFAKPPRSEALVSTDISGSAFSRKGPILGDKSEVEKFVSVTRDCFEERHQSDNDSDAATQEEDSSDSVLLWSEDVRGNLGAGNTFDT